LGRSFYVASNYLVALKIKNRQKPTSTTFVGGSSGESLSIRFFVNFSLRWTIGPLASVGDAGSACLACGFPKIDKETGQRLRYIGDTESG